MTDQSAVSRRQMLTLSAVGISLSLAGCAGQGEERRVTVSLQPTQEDIEPAQAEAQRIQQQQLTGEISQEEAQQQLSELQAQLYDGLIETATEEAESLDLTVEDSIDPNTLLVSGPEGSIIDFLDIEIVADISDAEDFEQRRQQQQQQQQQQEQTEQSGNDSTDEEETENESTN